MTFKNNNSGDGGKVTPPMDLTTLQSKTIDWLRFPLVVAVVFGHSFGLPKKIDVYDINWSSITGIDLYNLLRIFFSHVLPHIAVPTFFLISGYLFFYKLNEWNMKVYINKVKKKVHTLIIPYLIWNLISFFAIFGINFGANLLRGRSVSNVLLYLQEKGLHIFWDCNFWTDGRINWLGTQTYMSGPFNIPLWFLRDLIVVTLFTPLIYWIVKRTKLFGLLLLGIAYASCVWPDWPGFGVSAFFFFSIGAYLSVHRKNIIEEFRKVEIPSYILAFSFLVAETVFDGPNTEIGYRLYPFYIIWVVFFIFNITARLLQTQKVKMSPTLSNSSFFIYASHTILILTFCSFTIGKIVIWNNPLALSIRYMITPVVSIGVCLCLYLLMKKYTPKLLNLLTGNR